MQNIELQQVRLSELNQLQKIGKQTFFETFAESNSEEDMNKYLEEGFSSEKLTDELSNPNSQFYFATIEGKIVGYLKINTAEAQTELRERNAMEIERIYVLKEFHGQKVGQLLYEKAIEIAQRLRASYVWLGVWEKNPRAIRFYQKNGFVEFDKHIFILGTDHQTDIMMKLYV